MEQKTYKSKIIAQWYDKQFYISSDEMNTFTDFSASRSVETESKDNKKSIPTVAVKKRESGEFSITVPLNVGWCSDVRKEYETWEKRVGKSSLFYIGKKQYGASWLLKSASPSDIVFSNNGEWLKCKIALSFVESAIKKKAAKKAKKKLKIGKSTRVTTLKYNKKKGKYVKKSVKYK